MSAETVAGPIQAVIERLESHYDFQCEGGPLRNCVEWQELKRLIAAREPAARQEQEIQIAECIAREAHQGQREESTGDDYIHHVERVVALVEGGQAKAVAWLHDVLEDTAVLSRDLCRAGISDDVINAVEVLTRSVDETYDSYIRTVSGSGLARAVKIADLKDHLRPNCPERLRPRYEKALAELEALTSSR